MKYEVYQCQYMGDGYHGAVFRWGEYDTLKQAERAAIRAMESEEATGPSRIFYGDQQYDWDQKAQKFVVGADF